MNRSELRSIARGASQSRAGWGDRLRAWGLHHRYSAVGSLQRLLRTPLQTTMTSLVVAIALALPAVLWVALTNVEALGERWDASPKVSVYLKIAARVQAIEALRARIDALPGVAEHRYLTPDQALTEFQASAGFGDALTALVDNPLPPTIIVTPAADSASPEHLQDLAARLAEEAIVDEVVMDLAWVQRLQEMMALSKKIVFGLGALLALGVLLAVGNTIRLAIESRRSEIIVTKLVGGTDGFVRRPFLYTGVWYGVLGGMLASAIVGLGLAALQTPVHQLALAYSADFSLQGLGLVGVFTLMALSGILGLTGSWLAVSGHIHDIEPR